MPKKQVITAIDLGTDKCVTLIASIDEDTNELQVVGISAVPARGMRKSAIVDLEQVLQTLTESLDQAERMAGFNVRSAYVSVSGPHISSQNSKGVVAVAAPNQEISRDDVARVIEAARAISLPHDRGVIHVIPRDFKVDSQTGIKDPVGMTGIRLESEAHIITGMSTSLKNIQKSVEDVGLTVDGFVFSGLATAEVSASETEKELGVVVVDIGAGATSLCVYVEGCLEYSAALPIGARHITQDIALGCRISLESAEKIKLALSGDEDLLPQPQPGETKEELNKRRKKADRIDLTALGINEGITDLSRKTLVEGIMAPRMKEIFVLVGQELEKHNLLSQVPAGLILAGGGADTIGMVEVAKRTLRLPARVAKPPELRGLTNDICKPAFATSVGLLMYGKKRGLTVPSGGGLDISSLFTHTQLGPTIQKLGSFLKSLLP